MCRARCARCVILLFALSVASGNSPAHDGDAIGRRRHLGHGPQHQPGRRSRSPPIHLVSQPERPIHSALPLARLGGPGCRPRSAHFGRFIQMQTAQREKLAKMGPWEQEAMVRFAKLRHPLFPGMSPTTDLATMLALQRGAAVCTEQMEVEVARAVVSREYYGLTGDQIKDKVLGVVFTCLAKDGKTPNGCGGRRAAAGAAQANSPS